jgi:hypothetical protein
MNVKSLIFDVVLGAAVNSITAAVPFLSLPVIKPLFVFVVTKIAGAIYNELERYVSFTLIDIRTNEEKRQYLAAVGELKVVHESPTATPEEIELAKQKFKNTLRDLIRLKP